MIIVNALLAAVVGAFVGKFLGFVAHYLPLILLEGIEEGREPRDIFKWFFSTPICPNCRHPIEGVYNAPILGYALSRGRCPSCQKIIGKKSFPLELATALLFGLTVLFFSFSPFVLFVLLISCLLICSFITDFDHGILPDQFTLTLVWIGLIGSLYPVFLTSRQSIIGAVVGYGVFWLCNEIYRFFRHREGMYPGDFKLNAGIGACVGIKWLFIIIGISVIAMIVGSLAQFIYSNRTIHAGYLYKEIAYGCYASVVTFIVLYLMLAGVI